MPILATSSQSVANNPAPTEVPVTTVERAKQTLVDNKSLSTKMRSFVLTANQTAQLDFIFQDDLGSPYDLTTIPATCSFTGLLVEKVSGLRIPVTAISMSVAEADKKRGVLTIQLTSGETQIPGVYNLSISCNNTDDSVLQENHCYVYIARSALDTLSGPPDMLEIRLQLHDSSPEENLILDGLTFSDEEIALAVTRPVLFFNELRPDVGVYYSTVNFPYRYHWIEGTIAQLYRIAAEFHRKNNLQYSAGGVSMNDLNKEQNYAQMADRHWAVFADFCKREKVKMNVDQGFALIPSGYGYW